ncbi:hypothetical protein ACFXJ8_21975 [Nonomuraea sp. NPDC059194]|uniref:hypothetical protein n=1 Tax=Nonomuraea sp. NPDC059194 TaxID=3346764 RepID=UPI0036C2D5B2
MKALFSPFLLPRDALALAARFFFPLALFYTLGRIAHDLILVAAVYVGDVEAPRKFLGFAVMSMAVLATLAAYVAMLRTLRISPARTTAPDGQSGRLATLIGHTLLPFLALYGAWGLFADDVRQYSILAQELFGVQEIDNLTFDPLLTTSLMAAGAFAIRVVIEKAYQRHLKAWLGLLAIGMESMWMFFAVISIEHFIGERVDWLTSRAAWAGASDAVGTVLGPVGDAVAVVVPDVGDALVLPLVWVTIAAVVYGRDMGQGEALIQGTRVQARAGRIRAAAPDPVRRAAEFVSRDVRDKYTPMLNGLRMLLSAGPVFFLVFCLCYLLLGVGRDWAFIGVTNLVGPHESNWWTLWHGPIRFGVTAVYEVLRISLLAAALQMVLRGASAVGSPHPADQGALRRAAS